MKTMPRRFDRRRFMQSALAGAGALGLAPVLARGPVAARQAAGPAQALAPQPAFAPLPASLTLPFGPPADVSMAWDGTVWTIDGTFGAPFVYDPLQQTWHAHGTGIDAVAYAGSASAPTPPVPVTATPTPAGPTATPEERVLRAFLAAPPAQGAATGAPQAPATAVPTATHTPGAPLTGTPTPSATRATTATATASPTGTPVAAGSGTPTRPAGTATPGPSATPLHTGTTTVLPSLTPQRTPTAAGTPTPSRTGPAFDSSAPIYVFRGPEVVLLSLADVVRFGGAGTATASPTASVAGTPSSDASAATATTTPSVPATRDSPAPGTETDALQISAPAQVQDGATATATPGAAATPAAPPDASATPAPATPAPGTPTPGASATPTPIPPAPIPAPPQGTVLPIASVWPTLPATFQSGVDGAADVNGVLYLIKGGRYVGAAGGASPAKLTDLTGWPQAWQDGLVDLVASGQGDGGVVLVRGGEVMIVDLAQARVTYGPAALGAGFGGDLLARLQAGGVDALLYGGSVYETTAPVLAFQQTSLLSYAGARAPGASGSWYVAGASPAWPATWHPSLAQAPAGRVGGLWATTRDGAMLSHDGTAWSPSFLPGGPAAASVAVGADGAVFGAAGTTLYGLDAGGAVPVWHPLATAPSAVAQVAAGDATHVWLRDPQGAVLRYGGGAAAGGSFTAVDLGTPAAHLAANADGTLWHAASGRADAFRYISEGSAPSQALGLGQPGVTAVTHVGSTGFGTAYCLAQQDGQSRIFAYESPYLFKSATSYNAAQYGVLEQGLGRLFLTTADYTGATAQFAVLSLDGQTGQELWRAPAPARDVPFTGPVFDPLQQMVYVASTVGPFAGSHTIHALDAHTGEEVWRFQADGGVDATPALLGTHLCFGTRLGTVYLLDTVAAAGAAARGQAPTPAWVFTPTFSNLSRMPTPLIQDGKVYVVRWVGGTGDATELYPFSIDLATGQGVQLVDAIRPATTVERFVPAPAVVAPVNLAGATSLALVFNAYSTVYAIGLEVPIWISFGAPGGAYFSTGLTSADGTLWIGATNATLYGLDENLHAVHTASPSTGSSIYTTPAVFTSAAGQTTVVFGGFGPGLTYALTVYDPATGNTAAVDTGLTPITHLSPDVANGIVYAAGATGIDPTVSTLGQVFAIRVDAATAALRALIVESQLLQDYDEPTEGTLTAVARYQTHLTVVDDLKAPRPLEPVKVWADASTAVQIGGRRFTIDPTTPATVQTGADGSLTIVGNADDLTATPLRVWASFMDAHERVVIYPDREFHARLAATTADATGDDPVAINLTTAQDYGRQRLFADARQATSLATSVQRMTAAVGLGPAPSAGLGGFLGGGRDWFRPRAATTASKYVAYADLPGAAYFPANTPATRPAGALSPLGLGLAADGTFATLSPADAQAAIDGLQGRDGGAHLGGALSFFKHLWDDIKGGIATISRLVVSIAEDVFFGIEYVVGGNTYFFKHPLQAIEDVAAAVGSFFVTLGKVIKNVIEAISLTFHLDQVLTTQKLLQGLIADSLDSLGSDLTNNAIPAVNQFFGRAEKDIQDQITSLIARIKSTLDPQTARQPMRAVLDRAAGQTTGGTSLNGLDGMGSTPHTAFTFGPQGSPNKQSHAVQCTWAMRTLTGQMRQAEPSGPASAAENDPVTAFVNGFAASVTTDQTLKAALDQTLASFRQTFTVTSPRAFLTMAVADALDVLEAVLIAAVALVKSFVGALLQAVAASLQTITQLGALKIPILSTLFQQLTGRPLTFLDLATFVAAIPITLIYRIVDGRWPSAAVGVEQLSATSPVAHRLAGLSSGLAYWTAAFVTAALDTFDIGSGGDASVFARAPRTFGYKLAGGILLLGDIGTSIYKGIKAPGVFGGLDWLVWGTNMATLAVTVVGGGVSAVALTRAPMVGSAINSMLSLVLVPLLIDQYLAGVQDGKNPSLPLFVGDLLLAVPTMVNPLKFEPADTLVPLISPLADAVCRGAGGTLFVVETLRTWNSGGSG